MAYRRVGLGSRSVCPVSVGFSGIFVCFCRQAVALSYALRPSIRCQGLTTGISPAVWCCLGCPLIRPHPRSGQLAVGVAEK